MCVCVCVCVCVCPPPRLLVTSGVMWCDMCVTLVVSIAHYKCYTHNELHISITCGLR